MENVIDILFDFSKKSFCEIIKEVTEEDIQECEPENFVKDRMLSIIIGIAGETTGRMLLSTTVEDGTKIAEYMNFGEPLENKEDLFLYLAEFANMFCGRTATYINNKFGKREVWITPPSVFSAYEMDIITPNITSKKAYFCTSFGKFLVDVGYSDNNYDEF